MIDCQHLAILREVDRLGSVTAAAGTLNLTQSALSHSMRKFEECHGVAVWQKDGRGLRLKQAGAYLLALAQRVLPQVEHAERVLADFAAGQRGALRVGMECHPCQQWLMRIVAPYLAAWPDVDLDIRTAFRFGGIAALLGHEIDLLITPDPLDLPGIAYRPVFDYQMVLAVPRRHRTVETTAMMLHLVAAGRGVSAIPDWLLREEGGGLPIRAVRIGDGLPKSIHLGTRRGEEGIDYVAGFLALAAGTQPDRG